MFRCGVEGTRSRHTEFLPEEGQNLAGVELSRKTSDSGQRLATIALCWEWSVNFVPSEFTHVFVDIASLSHTRATSDATRSEWG